MNPIIQSFYDQISWASECAIAKIKNIDFVKTDLCLYLPCQWNHFEHSSFIAIEVSSALKLKPALIISGNPSEADAERIYWEGTKCGILISFVDPVAQVAQAQCMSRALDGLDWGRTIEAIAIGGTEPVWEWD